jgi:hypothetical protein
MHYTTAETATDAGLYSCFDEGPLDATSDLDIVQ